MDKMKDDQEINKLVLLLDHWVKHNKDHAAAYQKWTDKMEKKGLKDVSKHLKAASDLLLQSNQEFLLAKRNFKDKNPKEDGPVKKESAENIEDLSKEKLLALLTMYAKNWLAHDGAWFLSAEKEHGLKAAIKLDTAAWEIFTAVEARRIMQALNIKEGGGVPALVKALKFRLYARVNIQEIVPVNENKITFTMKECRVQRARRRDNRPDFPCKPVGIVEYSGFARTIDRRIKTKCLACPPDPHPEEYFCSWEFEVEA